MQVAVEKGYEQPSTPPADHFGTDITGQPHVKPRELTMSVAGDHDIECGVEN
jgi:hypothetical protein